MNKTKYTAAQKIAITAVRLPCFEKAIKEERKEARPGPEDLLALLFPGLYRRRAGEKAGSTKPDLYREMQQQGRQLVTVS